jgi:hypothetical protein
MDCFQIITKYTPPYRARSWSIFKTRILGPQALRVYEIINHTTWLRCHRLIAIRFHYRHICPPLPLFCTIHSPWQRQNLELLLLASGLLSLYVNKHELNYYYYASTALFLGISLFLSILILHTVDTTPWTGDQPVVRPLSTQRSAQTQNKQIDIHASNGIRTKISVLERAMTVHALDGAANVIRKTWNYDLKI